jgi:hypothetical protein
MSTQAEFIYRTLRESAKAGAERSRGETSRVRWRGLVCDYYPASGRASWFSEGTDVTQSLRREEVLALIRLKLGSDPRGSLTGERSAGKAFSGGRA